MQREGTGGGEYRQCAAGETSDDYCGEWGERETHVGAVRIIREHPVAQRDAAPRLARDGRMLIAIRARSS